MHRLTVAILVLFCWTGTSAWSQNTKPAPGLGLDVTSHFDVPEDLKVTVWAETPQFFNPTNMDVDRHGRIWVTEAVNYRGFRNRQPDRLVHKKGDRVVILEDTNGDGVCDSSSVFVQDPDLVAPLGIAVIGDKVVVSSSPGIFIYHDRDGDGKADDRETFLTGFGGFDHDHGTHAVVVGPDLSWYLNTGNAGPHLVRGSDGWTLRSGSIYRGGGPKSVANQPGMKSDDGRVWTGGLVARINPDGSGMEVLGHNFRNSYESTVDSFGNIWQNDNDDDGNRSCRIAWVMEGANQGFFSADGSRNWRADQRPGQATPRAHWRQDDPGVSSSGVITGAGAPTGIVVYEGRELGEDRRGLLLSCDAGRNRVWAYHARLEGAGFAYEQVPFLAAKTSKPGGPGVDKPGWFRPSDVAVGADGAVYVADWYDPGVGGHAMGDRQGVGRIYRVTRRGASHTSRKTDLTTRKGLVDALGHPAIHVRTLAAETIRTRGAVKILGSRPRGDAFDLARAAWLLAADGDTGKAVVSRMLDSHSDERVRVTAFRSLRRNTDDVMPLVDRVLEKPSPALLREAAIALRDIPFERCRQQLIQLARHCDGTDRTYLEAFGSACDGKEEKVWPDLVAALGEHPQKWSPAFARLAWRLHPLTAVPALAIRAQAVSLDAAARLEAVDALAFIAHKDAADAVLQLSREGPDDVRGRAAWWLIQRAGNTWHGLGPAVTAKGYDPAKAAWRSGIIKKGMVSAEVDLTNVSELRLVVTDGGDGNSHDWADWVEPLLVGKNVKRRLTKFTMERATSEWGQVRKGRNCNGAPMFIGKKKVKFGIGTHGHSDIVYRIPPGQYQKLKFKAGVDDGGSMQSGSKTSVEFLVFTQTGSDAGMVLAQSRQLTADDTPAAEQRRLARELVKTARGGMVLIDLAQQGRLSPMLRGLVGNDIFRNPDLSVRALASEHFQRSTADTEKLPGNNEILALAGDVQRGRQVFFSEEATCSKCHTHDVRGDDIGPDLTAIHTKYDRPQLLDAILNPSASIAFGYDTWLVRTKTGNIHTGFILADGETMVMKDIEGRKKIFGADDITQRRKQNLSTMPDNVALGLQAQKIADLVAFLKENPNPEPVFGKAIELFNGRDLTGWKAHLSNPKTDPATVWSVRDGVLVCGGRPAGYIRTTKDYTSYELTLEWRFDPEKGAGNSGVLLRLVGPDKVWPKSIEAQLMSRNAGDIWNIDKFPMYAAPERTRGRHTVKMEPTNEYVLGGWNRYRVRLHGGRLVLEVNDRIQNVAWDCGVMPGKIALQSEGAEIQFRNIRLRPIIGER